MATSQAQATVTFPVHSCSNPLQSSRHLFLTTPNLLSSHKIRVRVRRSSVQNPQ